MNEPGEPKKKNDTLTIRWLDAAGLAARYNDAAVCLELTMAAGERVPEATVAQAFPVSRPGEYLDFRDGKGEPVGMLRSLESLDPESRRAVTAALAGRSLIPVIRSIREIRELGVSVILWRVTTDRGDTTFHTESPRESVRFLTPDRIRITDLAGNPYDISSISALDKPSRDLLALLV
jgi:hypothetical protein